MPSRVFPTDTGFLPDWGSCTLNILLAMCTGTTVCGIVEWIRILKKYQNTKTPLSVKKKKKKKKLVMQYLI